MSDVHERLRRLLLVVPYVSRNPGITVDALARALGLSREELLRDLDLLTLVGGIQIGLFGPSTLTLGVGTPVTGPRLFDVEAIAQLNWRF